MFLLKKIFNKFYHKHKEPVIESIDNGIYKNLKTGEYWNWYGDPTNLKESKKWQDEVFLACGETIVSKYTSIFGNYTLVSYDDELNKVKIERRNKLNKLNESRTNL